VEVIIAGEGCQQVIGQPEVAHLLIRQGIF